MSSLASRRSLVHVLLLFVGGLLVMTQSERLGQSARRAGTGNHRFPASVGAKT